MTMTPRLEHGLLLLLIVMILVPVGLIIFVSGEVPYRIVPGEPVREAAQNSGITVTSVKDTMWNLPGATGGKLYTLSDNAGNILTLSTQTFDSAESRDGAIRIYNAHPVGRGKPVGSLIVIGQHVIYVTPANSPILQQIAPELKKKIPH
ncbi:MAG: hypothetical protein NTZ39_01240 [Methanoregula sp.]|nr:hypothetical protein [Methanoregula sp.]